MTLTPAADLKRHPIQVAAQRAGLTPHVLRAWEKRYGDQIVAPGRTEGGRRLYSDADVERLRLFREATVAGRRIGDLASHSTADLRTLVDEDRSNQPAIVTPAAAGEREHQLREDCLAAVMALDARRLDRLLAAGIVALTPAQLVDDIIAPLMTTIGEWWREGRLTPSHEHMATAVVQRAVGRITAVLRARDDARHILLVTPKGQRHELGALLAAAAAAAEGWRVTYLGGDLPADHIATAANRLEVDVVGLSLVYPADDPLLEEELERLRRDLAETVPIVVGGRAAPSYQRQLTEVGAIRVHSLAELRDYLTAVGAADSDAA